MDFRPGALQENHGQRHADMSNDAVLAPTEAAVGSADIVGAPTVAQSALLTSLGMPSVPYRGIESFRLVDRPIFLARDRDVRQISRLITIYRAIVISGDSGVGKSSLLNAGLIPILIEDGYWVERMRVQPLEGCEFLVERVSLSDDGRGPFLPSIFARGDSEAPKVSVGAAELVERVKEVLRLPEGAPPEPPRPPVILLCDQFEESVTLFEEAPDSREAFQQAQKFQQTMFDALDALIKDEALPVKLAFALREDYLPKVIRHFERFYPQIKNQEYGLAKLSESDLQAIIEGPYGAQDHNKTPLFQRRLGASTCLTLDKGLRAQSDNGFISLTETQIACRTLWDDPEEEGRFNQTSNASEAVQHLYEHHMEIAMKTLSEVEQRNAKLALTKLITSNGTRNIVSKDDMFRALAKDKVPKGDAEITMDQLSKKTRLVYLQARGGTPFYEIVSESLIPWIQKQDAIFQEEASRFAEEADRNARIARLKVEEVEQEERRRIKEEAAEQAERRLTKYRRRFLFALSIALVLTLLLIGSGWVLVKRANEARQQELKALEFAVQSREGAESRIKDVEAEKVFLRRKIAEVTAAAQSYQKQANAFSAQSDKFRDELGKSDPKGQESKNLLTALENVQKAASSSGSQLETATTGLAKVSTIIDNLAWVQGKTKIWGGPGNADGWGDSLALIRTWSEADLTHVFRNDVDRSQPPRASEFDPKTYYITARWDYSATPRDWLRRTKAKVKNPRTGKILEAQPVDWGPPADSGVVMAISPGLADALNLKLLDDAAYFVPPSPKADSPSKK